MSPHTPQVNVVTFHLYLRLHPLEGGLAVNHKSSPQMEYIFLGRHKNWISGDGWGLAPLQRPSAASEESRLGLRGLSLQKDQMRPPGNCIPPAQFRQSRCRGLQVKPLQQSRNGGGHSRCSHCDASGRDCRPRPSRRGKNRQPAVPTGNGDACSLSGNLPPPGKKSHSP